MEDEKAMEKIIYMMIIPGKKSKQFNVSGDEKEPRRWNDVIVTRKRQMYTISFKNDTWGKMRQVKINKRNAKADDIVWLHTWKLVSTLRMCLDMWAGCSEERRQCKWEIQRHKPRGGGDRRRGCREAAWSDDYSCAQRGREELISLQPRVTGAQRLNFRCTWGFHIRWRKHWNISLNNISQSQHLGHR